MQREGGKNALRRLMDVSNSILFINVDVSTTKIHC